MTDPRNKGNYERYLSQTHECKVLSKPELAEVLKNMQFKQVQKGQHLIDQYDVRNYTFFLKKGFFKTESVNSYCGSSFMSFLCPEMVFPLRGMGYGPFLLLHGYCANGCGSSIHSKESI